MSNRRDLRAGYDENEFLPGVADEVDNAKHYVPADDDEPYYGAGIEGGWGSQSLRIDRLQQAKPTISKRGRAPFADTPKYRPYTHHFVRPALLQPSDHDGRPHSTHYVAGTLPHDHGEHPHEDGGSTRQHGGGHGQHGGGHDQHGGHGQHGGRPRPDSDTPSDDGKHTHEHAGSNGQHSSRPPADSDTPSDNNEHTHEGAGSHGQHGDRPRPGSDSSSDGDEHTHKPTGFAGLHPGTHSQHGGRPPKHSNTPPDNNDGHPRHRLPVQGPKVGDPPESAHPSAPSQPSGGEPKKPDPLGERSAGTPKQ